MLCTIIDVVLILLLCRSTVVVSPPQNDAVLLRSLSSIARDGSRLGGTESISPSNNYLATPSTISAAYPAIQRRDVPSRMLSWYYHSAVGLGVHPPSRSVL